MPVFVQGKMKPRNGSSFKIVDAQDVEYKNLPLTKFIPLVMTEEEYNAWVNSASYDEDQVVLIAWDTT